eukprot:2385933-Ditylum_brightwellii.AAC.1
MDELVNMKNEGSMAKMLVKMRPELYQKHMHIKKGKLVLYKQLKKALYGTLRAALLFWEKLSEALLEWSFEINPCNWCITKKTINKSQCTIVWHVDYLKISHPNE